MTSLLRYRDTTCPPGLLGVETINLQEHLRKKELRPDLDTKRNWLSSMVFIVTRVRPWFKILPYREIPRNSGVDTFFRLMKWSLWNPEHLCDIPPLTPLSAPTPLFPGRQNTQVDSGRKSDGRSTYVGVITGTVLDVFSTGRLWSGLTSQYSFLLLTTNFDSVKPHQTVYRHLLTLSGLMLRRSLIGSLESPYCFHVTNRPPRL